MPTGKIYPGYPAIHPTFVPQIGAGSDGAYLGSASSFEGYASGTVTIGGTPTTGNTVTVTINGHAVTYTLVSGDTTTALVATHLASALSGDSTNSAIVTVTASTSIVTITSKAVGPAGEYTLSASIGGTSPTITATASDTELDYASRIFIAKVTFSWDFGGGFIKTFYQDFPYDLAPEYNSAIATMRSLGYVY
jgi:hypothetical protein